MTIKDKGALYQAYMPFVKDGGLSVPTSTAYRLGEEIFMLLSLPDDDEDSDRGPRDLGDSQGMYRATPGRCGRAAQRP